MDLRFAYPPQLIIVDGGKPQVNAAATVLQGRDIFLCGLAKRFEEVWLPYAKDPIIFPRNSEALYLFQRIRDEAHRFAVSYHTKIRSKRVKRSELEQIVGIGPDTRKKLIKHFGSLNELRQASVDQISPIVGPSKAKKVYQGLHNKL